MNNELDNMLREWSARQALPPARQRLLEQRVGRAWRSAQPAVPRAGHAWRFAFAGFAAGIALTLGTFALWRWESSRGRNAWRAMLTEERGLFRARSPAVARVFAESERLFGSNLHWIAQTSRDLDLGVAEGPSAGDPMVLRITLAARMRGTEQWQRIWKTELVATTDDLLEIAPPAGMDHRIALWIHRLDRDTALVENRLTLMRPLRMEAESSEILRFGVPRSVNQFTHGDMEYRILQTVATLGEQPCS